MTRLGVVGSVTAHAGNRLICGYLAEQFRQHGCVTRAVVGDFDGPDILLSLQVKQGTCSAGAFLVATRLRSSALKNQGTKALYRSDKFLRRCLFCQRLTPAGNLERPD